MATAVKELVKEETLREKTSRLAKATAKVRNELKKANIPAVVRTSTNGNIEVFTIEINEKKLRLWSGIADIEVLVSKPQRQAVINVVEAERVVTEEVNLRSIRKHRVGLEPKEKLHVTTKLRDMLIDNFPIVFPNPDVVKFRVTELKEVKRTDGLKVEPQDAYYNFTAKVTATVPASTQSFLVGYDEHDLFISMLPSKPSSVKHAHELLRPPGVGKDAIRQGEFFFQPVNKTVGEYLDRLIAKRPDFIDDASYPIERQNGQESTHYCVMVTPPGKVYRGKQFTIGWVTDRRSRGYRKPAESHHDPLFLTDWHEIIPNLEIEPPSSVSGRQTFD